MYFEIIKFCLYICVLIFVCSGLFARYSNLHGTACYNKTDVPSNANTTFYRENCINDDANGSSLANRRNDPNGMLMQQLFNLLTVLALIFSFQYLKKLQRETALLCDEGLVSASDFTVRVCNISRDFA